MKRKWKFSFFVDAGQFYGIIIIDAGQHGGDVMIKLATAFSGIGAIEQAFERLNIDYELEFIILLYSYEYINDISCLQDIAEENCYLKFLLYPDDFDYSQVDFSNY